MKISTTSFVSALVSCLMVGVAGCGDVPDITVTRTDSTGVALVTSEGADRALDWEFEERFRLGGDDDGPESFYSLSRSLVATDEASRIYVLDVSAHRVVVFDSLGRPLRTLGREGAGPGELQMPSGMDVDDGVVGVWDYGRTGIVRWGPDGQPLATFVSPAFYGGRGLELRPTGAVFTTTDLRDTGHQKDVLVVLDTTYDSGDQQWRPIRTVVSVPVPDAPMHLFESCGVGFSLPPLFFPDVEWAPGPDHRLFVSHETRYVVDEYRDGARVASYRRALSPRSASRALAMASLGEGMKVSVNDGPPCTIPTGEVVDARGFADRIPFISSLAVDPAGRIWVERIAVGDEPAFLDILAANGAYLGTLHDPPVPVAFLPSGDLLAIEQDAMDVDHLVVYRVAERTGG